MIYNTSTILTVAKHMKVFEAIVFQSAAVFLKYFATKHAINIFAIQVFR